MAGFCELVTDLGGDPDAILAAVHLDRADLAEPDRYLPLRAYIECQEIAARRLGRSDFGLRFGTRQDMSLLGPLAVAIANSPTARASIEVCTRFMHIHNPAFQMTLAPMAGTANEFLGLSVGAIHPQKAQQNAERILASFHKSLGQVGGADYRPIEIWLTHKPMSSLMTYREVFGVTPQFEAPMMGVSVSRSVLDAFQPGRSTQLRQIAEDYLKSLSSPHDATFTLRVANMLRGLLRTGESSSAHAAAALGIHERTLQRRLHDEGSSFEKIKDDVRRELAAALIAQQEVPLTKVASMLDYADSSAFTRSARRWFGEAPAAMRKRLSNAPAPAEQPHTASRVNSLSANLRAKRALESP